MSNTGKNGAAGLAAHLNPAGYVVAGVSIRSSSQVKFPGQLHDIKAAIRWLRSNAIKYNFDPNHIAIISDSSGGWTTAMAALTGDAPEMEGSVGTTGGSSKVQAAVAFYRLPTSSRWMPGQSKSAPGRAVTTTQPLQNLDWWVARFRRAPTGASGESLTLRHCGRPANDDPARRL
jgi:acetyl esterase/lipase